MFESKARKFKSAFTLIELLIVVLIIAILAAIAIPNFLEFQVRAKVARVKSDFRTIATGLEAYCVDEGTYPATDRPAPESECRGLFKLTTPIAYLANIPYDSFGDKEFFGAHHKPFFEYCAGLAGKGAGNGSATFYPNDIWDLESAGPDNMDGVSGWSSWSFPWPGVGASTNSPAILQLLYDPTNGTVSLGNIWRTGGAAPPEQWIKCFVDLTKR